MPIFKPTVKFQKLDPKAILPKYAHEGDSGMDLYALNDVSIDPGDRKLVETGLLVQLPKGYEAQVRSRSGLAFREGLVVANGVGTIDNGFRGAVGVLLLNTTRNLKRIKAGDRIGQLVVAPYVQVSVVEAVVDTNTKRGQGGFGSTGK